MVIFRSICTDPEADQGITQRFWILSRPVCRTQIINELLTLFFLFCESVCKIYYGMSNFNPVDKRVSAGWDSKGKLLDYSYLNPHLDFKV